MPARVRRGADARSAGRLHGLLSGEVAVRARMAVGSRKAILMKPRTRIRIAPHARLVSGLVCVGLLAAAAAVGQAAQASQAARSQRAGTTAPQLHVSGNNLVNARGQRVVLRGVDRSGGEYACVQGYGSWDGPMNQAAVTAMKRWHVNAVRVPLNEACWNGQSYVRSRYRGVNYRRAVSAYVRLLNRNGMVAILDLHWTDGAYAGPSASCSSAQARCQKPIPERATGSETAGWRCWLRGGRACKGIGYQVAGMQSLVTAIRAAGARNVIMIGGLGYANDLTQWLKYRPADPAHNLAASWHSYNFNACDKRSCWASQIAPVIKQVPVIAGEIGENDCAGTYIRPLTKWLNARSTSYLAWAWNAEFNCSSGPSLITSYAGAPTGFGAVYRSHLASLK